MTKTHPTRPARSRRISAARENTVQPAKSKTTGSVGLAANKTASGLTVHDLKKNDKGRVPSSSKADSTQPAAFKAPDAKAGDHRLQGRGRRAGRERRVRHPEVDDRQGGAGPALGVCEAQCGHDPLLRAGHGRTDGREGRRPDRRHVRLAGSRCHRQQPELRTASREGREHGRRRARGPYRRPDREHDARRRLRSASATPAAPKATRAA